MKTQKRTITRGSTQKITQQIQDQQNRLKKQKSADKLNQGGSPQLRKRDSKAQQKSESENIAKLLEYYNDMKSLHEGKELPTRQVHLRRLALHLIKRNSEFYRFPILQYVEETAKITLINDFELLYWYHLMKKYLKKVPDNANLKNEQVRLFFFLTSMFIKNFLLKSQAQRQNPKLNMEHFSTQIRSIEAYIKVYHYSNFDQAYRTFDRQNFILLNPIYQGDESLTQKIIADRYEQLSYLSKLKMRDLQKIFNLLREPFETDQKSNIIDYNWHVDGILKNSQSYNKYSTERRNDNQTAKVIRAEDYLPVRSNLAFTPRFNEKVRKASFSKKKFPKNYQSTETQITFEGQHPHESPIIDNLSNMFNPSVTQILPSVPLSLSNQPQDFNDHSHFQNSNTNTNITTPGNINQPSNNGNLPISFTNFFQNLQSMNNPALSQTLNFNLHDAINNSLMDLNHDFKSSPENLQRNTSLISAKSYNLTPTQRQSNDQLQYFIKNHPKNNNLNNNNGSYLNPFGLQRLPGVSYKEKENEVFLGAGSSFAEQFLTYNNNATNALLNNGNTQLSYGNLLNNNNDKSFINNSLKPNQQGNTGSSSIKLNLKDINNIQQKIQQLNQSNFILNAQNDDEGYLPDLNLDKFKSASEFLIGGQNLNQQQISDSLDSVPRQTTNDILNDDIQNRQNSQVGKDNPKDQLNSEMDLD
ncbi:UNKNOWN [Stylonychia lemnae]|uniref:Uncharacterized protein n=1 Tax=Stylonychia lemnae TaxID=5949 RepID=A0A078ACD8_STYLE|nr:UNKNOWN [Stylonychia lemnae]|eukprot:CDW79920.1 UNKNOWN [Stylonychia lemnae]